MRITATIHVHRLYSVSRGGARKGGSVFLQFMQRGVEKPLREVLLKGYVAGEDARFQHEVVLDAPDLSELEWRTNLPDDSTCDHTVRLSAYLGDTDGMGLSSPAVADEPPTGD